MACHCKKIWCAIAAILVVLVAADVVCMLAKCCKCKEARKPEPELTVPAPKPIPSAKERTAAKVAARLADKEYMAKLKTLENRQQELAVARTSVLAEFKAWQDGWIKTNDAARAIVEKINAYVASKNGKIESGDKELAALEAELKKLVLADPVGAEIQGRLDAIYAEEAERHDIVVGVIGDRLRKDMLAGAKAESTAAAEFRKQNAKNDDQGRGKPKREPMKPGYSNDPDPFSKPLVVPPGVNMPTNFPSRLGPTNAVLVAAPEASSTTVTAEEAKEAKAAAEAIE